MLRVLFFLLFVFFLSNESSALDLRYRPHLDIDDGIASRVIRRKKSKKRGKKKKKRKKRRRRKRRSSTTVSVSPSGHRRVVHRKSKVFSKRRSSRRRIRRRKPKRIRFVTSKTSNFQIEMTNEYEGGYHFAEFAKNKEGREKVARNRAYVFAKSAGTLENNRLLGSEKVLSYDVSARAWAGTNKDSDFSLRSANLGLAWGGANFNLGFQEIPWGETFGVAIADLINPKDMRDPLDNDPEWVRLPVFLANFRYVWSNVTLQLVATPFPRNMLLPKRGSSFDPYPDPAFEIQAYDKFDYKKPDKVAEYGGRVGVFFDFGLDIDLFYYHHWNRNVLYENIGWTPDLKLIFKPVKSFVDSVGMSYSMAFSQLVLRGDTVAHFGQAMPSMKGGHVEYIELYRSILGADYSFDNMWTAGLQYHIDYWRGAGLNWVSASLKTMFFGGKLNPEFFIFKGINSKDVWIQPKISWHITNSLSLLLQADLITATDDTTDSENSILAPLNGCDRYFGSIRYYF